MRAQYEKRPDHGVVVIGAGFSGIGAAVKLDEAGISDYIVLERRGRRRMALEHLEDYRFEGAPGERSRSARASTVGVES